MLIRNGCPRCGGHIYIDYDEYGSSKACITCGFRRDLECTVHSKLSDKKPDAEFSLEYYEEIAPLPLDREDLVPVNTPSIE